MSEALLDTLPPLPLFSERLTFAMQRKGLTQSELARTVGTTQQNVQHMTRRAHRSYRGTLLAKLTDALEVPAGWLACNSADTPVSVLPVAKARGVAVGGPTWLVGLSALQLAGLEALATLMRANAFPDEEVIDLLASLKPRLAQRKASVDTLGR